MFAAEAEAIIERRTTETLVVAMVDLDDFKGVNDRFGHGGGESVLIELADALGEAVGGDGIVGRFDGDEFVTLLLVPGDAAAAVARLDTTLDLDHAVYRAERGRAAIDASPPASPAHLRSADADRA